ncbi:MAG: hypothetical protein KIT84_05010 [Labilithrix sp.]|nr:hypothetical protein [Labilithrix sp.]MCW5810347.1 hypothetical protein [Labilithrix sp.]
MRISGIARRVSGDGAVLERARVLAGAEELASFERVEPFELETDTGERVRVELARSLRIEPAEERDLPWKEIEGDASLAALRVKNAPGPHVKVRLVRARVEDGARVELLAEDDAEHVFAVTSSHRRAPERRIAGITARAIATGDDAAAIVDRMVAPTAKSRPQAATTPRARLGRAPRVLELALAIAGALLLGVGWTMELSPLSVDLAALGGVLLGAAALRWTAARTPRFVSGGRKVGKLSRLDPGFAFLMLLVVFGSFIGGSALTDHATPWQDLRGRDVYNASPLSLLWLGLFGAGSFVAALVVGRAEARLVRVLLRAPRLPREGALERAWGSFSGVVRDPTPVTAEGEAVAIVHVVSEEIVDGSNPNIYTERLLSKGTFFLDGEGGQSLEVHPDDAVWASTVGLRVQKKEGSKTFVEHVSAVPLRGSVLLAGRVDRGAGDEDARVKATGVESLLFVAVREGGDARMECRAVLFMRRLALLVALTVTAGAVLTAIVAEPRLPAFNMPEGD